MQPTAKEILEVALDAAYRAGRITLGYFDERGLGVEQKEDLSPVTVADRMSEESIRSAIARAFPTHAIVGEEFGRQAGSADVIWYIDPIDGTKSFIRGVPLYGVMIGVEIAGNPSVGVVNFPALDEIYWGATGEGSYRNGRRNQVSTISELPDAALMTTSIAGIERDPEMLAGYRALVAQVALDRTWGDCYGHMLVASGRAEIMLDPKMSVWDSAALLPIVEEAGGVFTDWQGERTIHGRSAVSTNQALAETVRVILREAP
jgi:histidinol phosphatase-like enzyme (inositol monophosphatase family)